jgi:DNA-binding SARP family transcriptional activator
VEFRILGPLEVFDDGTPVRLSGRNQRALLALLLLNAGEVVSTDRLIDGLWGEDPPRTAPTSLQNAVSQLRKLLSAERIVTKAPGYVLRLLDGDGLDTTRVAELVAIARTSEAEARVASLREAETLWHGAPLAEFTFDSFAQSAIARLEELRLNVIEERIDADLELGRHREVSGELEGLLAEHPLRERLRSQLMLALYRSGRQADALQVYQGGRRALIEQLGIDPSPTLQRLHGAILRQERSLETVVVEASAEEGIEEIAAALAVGRLVPVIGAEVATLAHRLAERFRLPADGGKFCHFSPDGAARVVDVPNRYATELDLGRRTVILKLHGSVDPTPERAWESFVVTEDDYLDYLPESDLAAAIPVALAAHLRRSHFLFLGYAMQDWNLRLVLNRVWGGATVNYRSWAVAPGMPALERALWRRRDVDVLNVGLEGFVNTLVSRAGADLEAAR